MNSRDNPIVAARRERLQAWIDEHYHGSQAAFAAAAAVNQGELSGLLRTKSFGEKRAASLEAAAGMPVGFLIAPNIEVNTQVVRSSEDYLRVQHLDVEAGMGGERINADYPEIIREMEISHAYLRALLGFIPTEGRLGLITGRGDSMSPTIEPGEMLLIDTGMSYFGHDAIYAIHMGHGLQVKRLIDIGTAIQVRSDNPMYPAFDLPDSARIIGKVILRNRLERLG